MKNNEHLQCKAKRVDTGEWIVGYYFIEYFTHDEFIHKIQAFKTIDGADVLCEYEIDPSTLCRCTGLRDKNGTLIWERDIVATSNDNADGGLDIWTKEDWGLAVVQPLNPNKGFLFKGELYTWNVCDEDSVHHLKFLEVIGNAVDNPELLEGGAE